MPLQARPATEHRGLQGARRHVIIRRMSTLTPSAVYAARRARVAAQIGANAIAIVPTAPERQRNRDSDFPYRHDSYFYYLTGFTEPNAWLVITGDGRSTLFCQPKDVEREIWDGIRLGPDAAPAALGVDEAFSVNELDQRLPKLLENRAVVWSPFATHPGLETRIDGWLNSVRLSASSTMRPRYITAMRWLMCRMTARSWLMNR